MNENLVLRYAPEYWADVKGYKGIYQVSNLGNVRSLDRVIKYSNGSSRVHRGKLLNPRATKDGYLYVSLYKNKKEKKFKVHRLVLAAFLAPSKLTVHHINEVRDDNNLCNLMYLTNEENARIATSKLNKDAVLKIKELIRQKVPNTEIGQIYGVNHRTISSIKNGNTWNHVA